MKKWKWEKLEKARFYFIECDELEAEVKITTDSRTWFSKIVDNNVDSVTKEWNGADSLNSLIREYGLAHNLCVDLTLNGQTLNFGSERYPHLYKIPSEFYNHVVCLFGEGKDDLEPLEDWYDTQDWYSWKGIESIILLGVPVKTKEEADIVVYLEKNGEELVGYHKIRREKNHVTQVNFYHYAMNMTQEYDNVHMILTLKGQKIKYATRSMFNPVFEKTTLPNTGEQVLLFGIEKDFLPKLDYEGKGGTYSLRFK